ncbi:MAG: tyrosine-type recombinase/integrase [Saprospiraceae bacterium]
MIAYFEELLESWDKNNRIKHTSINAYRRSLNILKVSHNGILPSGELNRESIATVVRYMRSRKDEDSYIKKTLDHIKTFIYHAVRDESLPIIKANPVQTKDFGLREYSSDKIYLTHEEVNRIASLDLTKEARKEVVRDIFLMAVYTGQRYSDVISSNNWQIGLSEFGGYFLKYRSKKTGHVSQLPLKKEAMDILKKYPNGIPMRSNVELNRILKHIGKTAGIDQLVTRTEHRDGETITNQVPKYTQITMHTARRTFCTLAVRAGVPTQVIMKLSGHETESSFRLYIRHSLDDVMQDAMKHQFFK